MERMGLKEKCRYFTQYMGSRIVKKISMTIAVFILTTTTSHAYAKLAKTAGLRPATMKEIVNKVIRVETTTGSYHTKNRKSGAYGRYQIMPKTARAYAKKLHIPFHKWREPKNQDRIFEAIMADNIRSLKRNGLKISAFSIYGTHQQGAGGFRAIMKSKRLSRQLERNLRHNLPRPLSHVHRSRLKRVWMNYWKKKFV